MALRGREAVSRLEETLTAALEPGRRAEVVPAKVFTLRPRGRHTGEIVADRGDSWAIVFDGTATPRTILKTMLQPEQLFG